MTRKNIEIVTERLLLRPWRENDAPDLFEYARDPRVASPAGWPAHESVDFSCEVIKTIFSQDGVFAVTLKGDDKAIGCIGLLCGRRSNFDIPDCEGEISYWIGFPFWGKGLISEAMQAIIRYGFETLGLRRLWCGYFDGNARSWRVQQKCGFSPHHTDDLKYYTLTDDYRIEHVTTLSQNDYLKV